MEMMDETDDDDDSIPSLVQIPYSRLIRNYTLVPISSFLAFIGLIALLTVCYPPPPTSPHSNYPLTSHYREFFTGCAAWVVSFALRIPVFLVCTLFGRYVNLFTISFSAVSRVFVEECIRFSSLLLLAIHLHYLPDNPEWVPYPNTQDDAFRQVWWFALGWGAVEVVSSIAQGYEQLALYKDILDDEMLQDWGDDIEAESIGRRYVTSILKATSPGSPSPASCEPSPPPRDLAISQFLEEEMAELIAIKDRAELELVYGVPPPNIPVFISCLQRLDSLLLTLGLTLLISSSYLSSLAINPLPPRDPSHPTFPPRPDIPAAVLSTVPAFIVVVFFHSALALLWTEPTLPKLGVHTVSYAALLVALALFFGGLATWGALV
jgi:hypothetical protein